MAENKGSQKVDQGKVKAEAEGLAKGQNVSQGERTDATPEAATSADIPDAGPNPRVNEPRPMQAAPVTPLDEDEAEAKIHEQAQKEFGKGYVRAVKGEGKNAQETIFTARAWDLLGNNKEGWKPKTRKPKEVKDLEEKKAANETGK